MVHCNNVSWVFPIHSVRVRGVISDWRLIPVRDWLVCLPLAWFFTGSFGGACSVHVCRVISDWRLIPVRDYLVCLLLAWFFACSFGSVCSVHVHGVISDWRLIPVHDWLVCSPLAWFFAGSFGGASFCFISALILMEVRSLCALMPCYSIVYCCAFLDVSIALRKGYVFWPWSSEFFCLRAP